MQNPFNSGKVENFYSDNDDHIPGTSTNNAESQKCKRKKYRYRNKAEASAATSTVLYVKRADGELSDVSENELSAGHNEISIIKMSTNEMDIQLRKNPVAYYKTVAYDTSLTDKDDFWHMIVVHQPNIKYLKQNILCALFDVVSDSEFFPIAYRQAKYEDYFLLRLCRVAIGKLFKTGLKIRMPDAKHLYLTIKLCVADYMLGHIHPSSKLLRACMDRFNDLICYKNITRVLNLDNLSDSPELTEIIINLSNHSHLEMLCTTLNNSKELLNSINGLKLSNNNLSNLKPFELLPRTNLQILDLSNNKIADLSHLKYLDKLTFNEIIVSGNPFSIKNYYENDIQEIFPAVTNINGKSVTKQQTSINMLLSDIPIDIIFLGDVIRENNVSPNIFFKKYKSSDMWHQIIMQHDGKFSKNQILQAIFNQLTGHEFYPCYYRTGTDYDTFFIRNCFDQMEVLYNAKMIVKIPNVGHTLRLTFKMNVANFKVDRQIDVADQLTKVIGVCFNIMDKTYNLEKFQQRDELKNIEIHLSNPKMLAYVLLQGTRRFLNNIEVLNLNDNSLKSARGMHALNWMKKLKSINLSNNEIESLADIEMIPKTPVTEVWLAGNSLYKIDPLSSDYLHKIKKIFPDIKELDGENLYMDESLVFHKNYFCSPEGFDLVEQFVKHFFSIFDSLGRHQIKGVYHHQAMLTITANFAGISRSNEETIKSYINSSRNILKHINHPLDKIYYGPEQIVAVYRSFGSSEHDFRSFTIDLLQYTTTSAVFTIHGLFKEQGATLNEEELILGFVRTFALKLTETRLGMFGQSSEYKITNEQVHFYRPSVAQMKSAFKTSTIVKEPTSEITDVDKEGLVVIFEELTNLVPSWCARCLKESDWHFKSALELFIHLCKENKLPQEAFKFRKV